MPMELDLKTMTLEAAQALLGVQFRVELDGTAVCEIKLIDAQPFDMPKRPGRGTRLPARPPFAIYFLGPQEPLLQQHIYTLRSPQGDFPELFIGPVGRDEEGVEYEAVFS